MFSISKFKKMHMLLYFCFLVYFVIAFVYGKDHEYCPVTFFGEPTCVGNQYYNCQPSQACGPDFLSFELDDNLRSEIAKQINFFRNKVAYGETHLPRASHMSELHYSKYLEKTAKCWANMCLFEHDNCRNIDGDEYVGQNMNVVVMDRPLNDEAIPNKILDMIEEWFEGISYINKSIDVPLPPDNNLHDFYRLVWDKTRLVGCGFSQWRKEGSEEYYISLTCNFRPSGIIEQFIRPYKMGESGSNCENGHSSEYQGLCKRLTSRPGRRQN